MKAFTKKILNEIVRDLTSFGNPIILIIISAILLGFGLNLIIIILGLIIVEIICSIIKLIYKKERPNKEEHSNILEKINSRSFPSLHAARSSFVFLTLFFLSNSNISKTMFIAMILLIGLTRILLKKHYLIDVIVGYAIGGIIFLITRTTLWH